MLLSEKQIGNEEVKAMNRRLLSQEKEGDRDPAGAIVVQWKCLLLFLL